MLWHNSSAGSSWRSSRRSLHWAGSAIGSEPSPPSPANRETQDFVLTQQTAVNSSLSTAQPTSFPSHPGSTSKCWVRGICMVTPHQIQDEGWLPGSISWILLRDHQKSPGVLQELVNGLALTSQPVLQQVCCPVQSWGLTGQGYLNSISETANGPETAGSALLR